MVYHPKGRKAGVAVQLPPQVMEILPAGVGLAALDTELHSPLLALFFSPS
jgi:hypothetical protein